MNLTDKEEKVAVAKQFTALEKSNVKLTLTVPQEEVRSQYGELIKDYRNNAQLPGFRKGKVPQEVLERKFGDALKNEALSKIIEAAVAGVFEDKDLSRNERPLPYAHPQLDEFPTLDLDKDLVFSITYDVLPKITVGKWQGLDVEAPGAEITDEDITRELDELRERNAIVLDKDEGAAAANGDVATVDYAELGDNDEEVPSGSRKDFVFTLGTGYNVYQFDDEVTGMKCGDTKEFSKSFPADYEEQSMAGKTVKIKLTLTTLKEKKLPDLDDEFAQDIDEKYKTLADLKNDIRGKLDKKLQEKLRDVRLSKLLEKIMETTPVVLPESMIAAEMEGRWRNMARRFNTSIESVMQMAGPGKAAEDIQNEWRPAVEKALHSRLIIETLIEQENMQTSDDEVEKMFGTIAEETGANLEDVKKYYETDQAKEMLKEEVKERKLIDRLLAENTIKSGKTEKYLDLMTNFG